MAIAAREKEPSDSGSKPGRRIVEPKSPRQQHVDDEAWAESRARFRHLLETTDLQDRIDHALAHEAALARGENPLTSDIEFFQPLKPREPNPSGT